MQSGRTGPVFVRLMSEDYETKRTDMHTPKNDLGDDRPAVEDPLVELARIVHKNKQSGANVSSGRVESTDYFAGLEDFAGETAAARTSAPARVEPTFSSLAQPQPVKEPSVPVADPFPGPAANDPAIPERANPEPAWQEPPLQATKPAVRVTVSANPVKLSTKPARTEEPAPKPSNAGLSGSVGFAFGKDPERPEYPAADIPAAREPLGSAEETGFRPEPASDLPQDLEQNLTAELENELIGALRQAVDEPVDTPAREHAAPVPPFSATQRESSFQGFDTGGSSSRIDTQHTGPSSYPQADVPVAVTTPEQPARSYPEVRPVADRVEAGNVRTDFHLGPVPEVPSPAAAPVAETGRRRPAIDENDFLAALNPSGPGPETGAAEQPVDDETSLAGIDALFADLDFPDPANRKPVPATQPPAATALSAAAEDIDEMTWPAAAEAVPQAEEDETPPPPEGYDLDAVARAMQESDPTLNGAGVLPPHSTAEKAAIPHAREKSRKGVFVAAGVLGVAVLGGAGFLLYDGDAVPVPSGPPPIISGLQEPLKVFPAEAPKAENNQSSKLIYDRVGDAGASGPEKLVLPETPKPAELPPAPASEGNGADLAPGAPRQVRTVIVRLDDTLPGASGAGEDAASAPEAPSVPRVVTTTPVVPSTGSQQPAAAVPAPAEPTVAEPAPATPEATSAPATEEAQTTSGETSLLAGAEEAAAAAYSGETVAAAPVPTVLPRKKPEAPVRVASAPVEPAPASTSQQSGPLNLSQQASAPAAPAPQAPAASGGEAGYIAPGTYIVQVTSQRSASAASGAYAGLQRKYPGVLGNREAVIVKADLGDKGTFYRARIPTGSRDEAISLCESLKGAGGDCFVRRQP